MKKISILFLLSSIFFACQKQSDVISTVPVEVSYGTMQDERDEQSYRTIKIGDQEWMAENLRYRLSRGSLDGCYTFGENTISLTSLSVDKARFMDSVKNAVSTGEIVNPPDLPVLQQPTIIISLYMNLLTPKALMDRLVAYPEVSRVMNRIHNNLLIPAAQAQAKINLGNAENRNGAYAQRNGFLYTHAALKDLAPKGWRVATDEDWQQLEKQIGMPLAEIEALEAWRGEQASRLAAGSDNGVGFDAPLGGGRIYGSFYYGTPFVGREVNAYYWTSSILQANDSTTYGISRNLMQGKNGIWRGTAMRGAAYHVRCIKIK